MSLWEKRKQKFAPIFLSTNNRNSCGICQCSGSGPFVGYCYSSSSLSSFLWWNSKISGRFLSSNIRNSCGNFQCSGSGPFLRWNSKISGRFLSQPKSPGIRYLSYLLRNTEKRWTKGLVFSVGILFVFLNCLCSSITCCSRVDIDKSDVWIQGGSSASTCYDLKKKNSILYISSRTSEEGLPRPLTNSP